MNQHGGPWWPKKFKTRDEFINGHLALVVADAASKSSDVIETMQKVLPRHWKGLKGKTFREAVMRARELGHKIPDLNSLYLKRTKADKPQLDNIRFPFNREDELEDAQKFIITSALNDAPLDQQLWATIKRYAKLNNAMIIVVPARYLNPTTRGTGGDYRWPDEVLPYLTDDLIELHEHLHLMGHIRIQASATDPLSSIGDLSKGASAIFGHAQLAMQTVATPQNKLPKVLWTTASTSEKEYSDTKQGIRARFHHTRGALVVELDGPRFHARPVLFDGEGFQDVEYYYTPEGRKREDVSAVVFGDIHVDFMDPKCKAATFTNKDSIVKTTRPKKLVEHDVIDSYSISHHHEKNAVTKIAKAKAGMGDLRAELDRVADFLNETTPEGAEVIVVDSNHHTHILQWMNRATPLTDPGNADILIDLWHALKGTIKMGRHGAECGDPMALYLQSRVKAKVRFLRGDESCLIEGIEVGQHGHNGINGSRGSIKQFAKLGIRTITGHCLTEEHDVLTRTGWTPIERVSAQEEILSYDWESGKNAWAVAEEKQHYLYNGPMVRIRHVGAFDQEVTPNHKLLFRDGSVDNVCEAILTKSPSGLPITALPEDRNSLEIEEGLLRKIVAVCADGSFSSGSLRFNVAKQRKKDRLVLLFGEDLGPTGKINPHNGSQKRVVKKDSLSYAAITTWVSSQDKRLPKEFINLSSRCREILLDELQYWDGTFFKKGNAEQFSSFKEDEARLVASLVTLSGYRCTLSKRPDSPGWIVSWCRDREHTFVSSKDYDKERSRLWGATTREVVDEPVYCFTVAKHGCFWVRSQRTGLVSLTHNSHTPGIHHGAHSVGSSTGRLEYEKGPSTHAQCHVLIFKNGKRQPIFVITGRWRKQ